ncbi:MAG: hypothetical protein R3335_05610 [Anaerolineales bacterium]|nr:hypothetical protein [Anaerolineales bacterium]
MEEITIRDTLFGDMPLSAWAGDESHAEREPWRWFSAAREHLDAGDQALAVAQLQRVIGAPGLETRHYLQAWHFLRQLGVAPPETAAKNVLGVVLEVSLADGLDLIAAYADHSARYFNFSGGGVIWDSPDDSLNPEIEALLRAAEDIVQNIGPWEEERPPPPPVGQVRVNILAPGGLHFGQAPFEDLANDAMGGPIVQAALALMQALIAKSTEASA